jgi:L-ascorbate metabolism protein UlaG (beta-lactamase superfamily)
MFFTLGDPARPWQPPLPDPRALPAPAAVAITHADHDHCHPGSLLRLPPAVPIIVPAVAQTQPFQVDLEALLALLGFTDVRALAPWQAATFADVTLTAAPFVGEDWGLPLQQATYVVSGPAGAAYLAADSLGVPETAQALRQKFALDVALLGVSGCAENARCVPQLGYGHFYAGEIPEARRNQWLEHTATPAAAAQTARLLGARQVFGYAAGGGPFIELAFSDRGSHDELTALLVAPGDPTPVALPLGVPWRWRR